MAQDWKDLLHLRQRVTDQSKAPLVIIPVTLADPAIVEIIGFAGAEAVLLDCEHGMIGPETARSMLAHAAAAGVPAVFRPRSFDAAACRQALDQGAAGVHVPHVDSADQARAVVNACRYSPVGRREMSLGRAVWYQAANISSYVAEANERLLLVVMIESVEGLASVEAIAAVPGIDVIHLGIADLSHAMGLTGQYDHPEVNAAVERVLEVAGSHGVAVGYPTQDPEKVAFWMSRGIRYFEADTPDYLLRETYAQSLSALREVFSSAGRSKSGSTSRN
ncbi:MAG: 4-hydroxy-2-oxovalerate aldolase [Acidimicrobiia bacterium]|nr:4-hydroxy-2-oxovalerate aldolase [Acidimicrobiia bacterium]